MKSFESEILVFAHRGASSSAPENTLAAFQKAIDLGADGIELDVQLTRDQQVIVLHDETLDRTTSGKGKVAETLLAELQTLDAGLWFSKQYGGQAVPTLEQVLLLSAGKVLVNIELKTNPVPDLLVSKVLDAMIRFEVLDQCLISSFDIQAMQRFARAHPNIRCGVICKSQTPEIWQGEWVFVIAKWKSLTPDFLQQAQKHGKKVIAWTVDNKRTMRSLMKRGVKRLITDTPDSYIELLQDKKYLDSK